MEPKALRERVGRSIRKARLKDGLEPRDLAYNLKINERTLEAVFVMLGELPHRVHDTEGEALERQTALPKESRCVSEPPCANGS